MQILDSLKKLGKEKFSNFFWEFHFFLDMEEQLTSRAEIKQQIEIVFLASYGDLQFGRQPA